MVLVQRDGGIVDVPEIQGFLGRGNQAHADIVPLIREGLQRGVVERRLQGRVVGVGADPAGAERLEIIAQVELRPGPVVVFHAPDHRVRDPAVGAQVRDQLLGVVVQFIEVVARQFDGIRAGVGDDVVVEIAVVDARHAPVGPAEIGGHRDDLPLDARRQPGALVFGLEQHADVPVVVACDARFEDVDLLEMREVVLHRPHHLVELLDGAALRHAGGDGELRPGGFAIEIRAGHRLVEETEGRTQDLVHGALVVGVRRPGQDLVHRHLPRLERAAVPVAVAGGQQAGGDAEERNEQHHEHPAPAQAPLDAPAVCGAEASQAALPTGRAGRRARPLHREIVQQGRHEEVGHQQRHAEVDHDHPGKVRQVGTLLLGHQQDHEQRRHRGHHGAEQRREDFPVAAAGIVVDHHDAVVDDDAQRDGHARQGVNVDLQAQEIVQCDRDQQVDREGHGDHQHIAPRARHHEDEEQQDQQAERRPEIDAVQFFGDILRIIITHRDADFLRETGLELRHPRLDVLHHAQQVGVGGDHHLHREHVEAVDAVIGVRQRLLEAERGNLAQVHHAPVHPRHGDVGERFPAPAAAQFDAPGPAFALGHAHDLLAVIIGEGAADLRGADSGCGGLVGVEGDHPFEGRLPVEIHAAHPLHDGERVKQFPFHEIRDLLRGQGAADDVGNGRLGLFAAGVERDGRVGTAVGEFRVEVADLGGHLEADGLDVGAPGRLDGHGTAAVAGNAAGRLHGADRGEDALQLAGHLRLHDARRGAGIAETDRNVARGGRGGVLHLEAREAGDARHRRHRHQQQHREGRYAPALRHQRPRFL